MTVILLFSLSNLLSLKRQTPNTLYVYNVLYIDDDLAISNIILVYNL